MIRKFTHALYIPAISIATHCTIIKRDWKQKSGKSPRFYLNSLTDDTRCFHHPYILASAGHNYKNMDFMRGLGINDIRKDVDMVFGDSGGFQIATGEIKGTEEQINILYDWMEKNSTVSPIIDCPPWKNATTDISMEDIKESIIKTKANVDILHNRPESKVGWLNVMHGRGHDQRSFWYNNVKDWNLNGWALGSLRKNSYNLLTSFCSLLDNNEFENKERCQHVHFFGFSASRYIPYIIYLKHKLMQRGYDTNISFDSSYATQNGGNGKYFIFPNAAGFTSYHLTNKCIGKHKNVPLPCNCPVCDGVMLDDIMNAPSLCAKGQNLFYNIVQSHNVYMISEYVKTLHNLIFTDCETLWQTCFKAQQLKVFKIIDKMFAAPNGKAHEVVENNVALLNKIDNKAEVALGTDTITDMFGKEEDNA